MGASSAGGISELFDREIAGFSIDSRSTQTGELFFALHQEDYTRAGFNGTFQDGHEFIADAFDSGAIAAVAKRSRVALDDDLKRFASRLLIVEDVIEALQTLSAQVYRRWGCPVVAITGSAGKTTTKDLVAHLLQFVGKRVLKSERNLNNGLGLPLSVLKMVSADQRPEDYDVAVLEMGMSSPTGEIARLCKITPPDVGVELCVAPAHLEHFGTIERIAEAKAELVDGLKPDGVAVLNADDPLVLAMRDRRPGRCLTFGIENQADVTALAIDNASLGLTRFRLRTPSGEVPVKLPLPGRHNLMNALAAAAAATCFDIEADRIAEGLRSCRPSEMRGEILDFAAGFRVIDDSYNSNPRALLNMVRTLVEGGKTARRRIVVAGEMLELGSESKKLHRETGRQIARSGVDVLWGVSDQAEKIIQGAREEGMSRDATDFFSTSEEAASQLCKLVREGDLILIKGSRGVRTDKVVHVLREHFPVLGADEA